MLLRLQTWVQQVVRHSMYSQQAHRHRSPCKQYLCPTDRHSAPAQAQNHRCHSLFPSLADQKVSVSVGTPQLACLLSCDGPERSWGWVFLEFPPLPVLLCAASLCGRHLFTASADTWSTELKIISFVILDRSGVSWCLKRLIEIQGQQLL